MAAVIENQIYLNIYIPSQRVLTYHEGYEQEIKRNPMGRKQLTQNPIYQFGNKSEEFPFSSLNPLKSNVHTWTLINITPEEVYDALRQVGFVR